MSSPGTCATRSGRASRWSVSIAPIAFELVTAILQLDAPGHDSTSAIVIAPACPRPAAVSSRCSSATRQVGTKRITRFCSLVVRISPSPNLSASTASARNCAGVMSPFGKRTITAENPACFCARTFVFCERRELRQRLDRRAASGTCHWDRARLRRRRDRQRTAALGAHRRQVLVVLLDERGRAELLDHPLDPRLVLVLAVAEPVEGPHHRLRDLQHLGDRQELVHQDAGLAQRRQTAAHVDLEAVVAVGVDRRQEAEVVDLRLDVVEAAAAAEGDLELARQRRRVRAAQQVPRDRSAYGETSNSSCVGDAGERAAGDVADRVAAGLARREPDVGHQRQRQLGLRLLDEVELDVLARGHVADAAAGPLLGDLGERLQLLRRWPTPYGSFTRIMKTPSWRWP